ncbi:DivIVA domain-containing protein [Solihabitans fulvus]|uniref:DivIVA domain-containing protein n=1 Tax=Solihabitans fulvus TaxID=1892852 RepID=A0A5B2WQV2_9PSEU|nr:DivIVA domain-containing protein [Solihabitans fulvus]KAA2252906.1 DivIVA domain-containing protein [Solihabitans fulvus]
MSPGNRGGAPFPSGQHTGGQAPLSAAELRRIRLPRAGRGYLADQVDEFVARIADALSGRVPMRPEEVREVRFAVAESGQRGYDQRPVDELLAEAERQLRTGRVAPTRLRTGADLLAARFRKSQRGYDFDEVDGFLDRAAEALDGQGRMTSTEVRNSRFSITSGLRRGYQAEAVDYLLDELEQELRSRGR